MTAGELPRSVGVEEEFLLVDPDSGQPRAVAGAVLTSAAREAANHGDVGDIGDDGDLTGELQREQVETGTRPCHDLGDLHSELLRTRSRAAAAARSRGVALAPLATSPVPVTPTVVAAARYQHMLEVFGLTGSEQLTCGCHVHVGIASEEEGVAALDRIRPWLAPLLALSANSPFWDGAYSGYGSFRSQVWGRWPSAGPTGLFGSLAGYREVTGAMLDTATVIDDGMLYFDARLSAHHPTLEIRVADVCLEPQDAVLVAALARALVDTAVRDADAGIPPDPVRTEVLRLATWRAGRSGLDDVLIDPRTWRPAPAADVITALLHHVTAALEQSGDLPVVRELIGAVLRRGTGATRQRAVHERTGDLAAVVAAAVVTR
ncbi:carboxylate-amine ligase [Pseudonocardia sp. GCM10023141]|uniref:carboxylate-amine ligase n=1 Tax=Pseudonocardia sp. GCM10023141 TaxID=3252653 RepID=UPI00361511AF